MDPPVEGSDPPDDGSLLRVSISGEKDKRDTKTKVNHAIKGSLGKEFAGKRVTSTEPDRYRLMRRNDYTSTSNTSHSDNQHHEINRLVSESSIVKRKASQFDTDEYRRGSLGVTTEKCISDQDSTTSPTNGGFDDDYEYDNDQEEDEEFETTGQNDELENLSRQSMMPLHELIAYYQYIQQSDDGSQNKTSVSRQSSSVSGKTVRINSQVPIGNNDDDGSSVNRNPVIVKRDVDQDCANESEEINAESRSGEKNYITKVNVENKIKAYEQSISNNEYKQHVQSDAAQGSSKDKRRVRANVVLELINSERDFVKHLKDVVEGYLYPARRHPEIFTGERISTIFSNIEQLYKFQRQFLDDLESCINWSDLAASEVGVCFLKYEKGFSVYHFYCNNHPNASSELQELYTKARFVKFFEACRLLQNMIDISLDGFLLTPIQKICKYPLQLNELLKNTGKEHPDYLPVMNALESMRNCANLANERKRRIEALADVMSFQEKVENWFGPKLSDSCSILIHSGEVSKMTSNTWSQGVQLYLFDHLLLYAKKDLLKRNVLILKGRINMDSITEIADADEYKPKRSFKLYCSEQQKWIVFTTKSEKEKDEWIRAFERERSLVEADENEGFQITNKEIGIARRTIQNRKHSRSARYQRHKRPDTAIVDQLDLDDANAIMNRTLSLPSCIHPSHVMNFVEDSRVVSGARKKSLSPSQGSRSPIPSSYCSSESDTNQQAFGGGSWFRKMGSKKLARSQVYNVNGSMKQAQAQDPTTGTFIDIANSTAAEKYDQLEKRHRDHMSSEEQARLFRLNNDLPMNFSSTTTKQSTTAGGPSGPPRFKIQAAADERITDLKGDLQSLSLSPSLSKRKSQLELNYNQNTADQRASTYSDNQDGSEGSFEATVVLSSGRVVRIREDAV